jgi:hypothetical protein
MGKPLDAMNFNVIRRPGAWTDGVWVPTTPTLTVQLDGSPTPKSTATLNDVSPFTTGEYATFYDAAPGASGAILGTALIVSIDVPTKVITFATDSLTWDAEVGDWVAPAIVLEASRPQPVGPELIEFLDEGARTSARFVIYAEGNQPTLQVVERDEVGFAADRVPYNGKDYLVTSLGDWDDMPLGYRDYILLAFAPDETVKS